ncbi:MAG: mechanosensitive ion channel family protein [Verrucomicrobia bacterium]|jgi:MscS family membrane protein|nr:mechanosensitive ion channel family protein [Verrucomicrobiota bacterium]
MQRKFEWMWRSFLILLCGVLLWSVWRAAAQDTNAVTTKTEQAAVITAAASTNEVTGVVTDQSRHNPMVTPHWVENLAVDFPFLKWTLWGNELWKYLFSLVYIFLAFYISKFLDYLTRVWLKKWAEKTETKFDDLLLELLNGPVKVVAFVIFLRIGLDVFQWPEMAQKVLAKGFTIIVAVSLTYMVLKFIDLVMGYWRQRVAAHEDQTFNRQLFPIVRKSLKVFIIAVAALVTLDNLGINITAAIASLSIGGLAVGLAAQDTLANLFGAIAIFLDKPFKIGDRIQIDNVDGPVESIGLRSTRVRNLDGHLVTIPNKTMGNATITNIAARPNIKTVMNIGLTYDTSVEKVRLALRIIKEIYGGHPMTGDLVMSFNKFESSSLNILVVHWWKNPDFLASLAGLQEMNLALKERFDAEKIEFAFPTQTVYVKQS